MKDRVAGHAACDDPSSPLRCVRSHRREAVDQAPPGRVSLASLCAGQGQDVTGVLPRHPRRDDVRAVLVESGERNAALASFADVRPADVLLLCGICGNVSDRDIKRAVRAAPALCRAGATVI